MDLPGAPRARRGRASRAAARFAAGCAVLASLGLTGLGAAQARLLPRSSLAHSGIVSISGRRLAQPVLTPVVSGGNLNVGSMALGADCVGYATARADVIVHYTEPGMRLSFAVRGHGADTALVVHTPDGRWLCDDDSGGDLSPRLEDPTPTAGQYDVWVASYRIGDYHDVTLSVGEP